MPHHHPQAAAGGLQAAARPSSPGLRRFNIRICTGRETALQTCIVRSQADAWNVAFTLAERLLGDVAPRSISVKPMGAPRVPCLGMFTQGGVA